MALATAAVAFATVAAAQTDPRAGLKPGIKDAGQTARNMSLVSNTPPPEGFRNSYYDGAPPPPGQSQAAALAFASSDLAFSGTRVFQGNYQGFNVFDVANPTAPKLVASIACPGGQHDVAVYGKLMFLSVEATRARLDCGVGGPESGVSKERFRGIRIFDISNIAQPRQLAAVQTCRGSHTLTLVPDPRDPKTLYIYNSGNSSIRSGEELAGCVEDPTAPNTSMFSIDVIKVPLDAPEKAAIVNRPRLFADASGSTLSVLSKQGPAASPAAQPSRETRACHDITVYPQVGLAGGACQGNGLLVDISDPANPKRIDAVTDPNFAAWHSATFNNAGTTVLFTDEWGGGSQPRCRPGDPEFWGGDATFNIVDRKMLLQGHFKIPNNQGLNENCVAHNGNLIPVPGRDIMVQSWYQGGISIIDFTNPAKPTEIGFFDRGPLNADQNLIGGYWSVYWNNGLIYGSEIGRGLDILKLETSPTMTKNELAAALLIKTAENNPQTQTKIVWPDQPVVARAYLDQLVRGKSIDAARAAAVDKALASMETGTKGGNAALVAQLKADGAKAAGRDAERFDGIARILSKA